MLEVFRSLHCPLVPSQRSLPDRMSSKYNPLTTGGNISLQVFSCFWSDASDLETHARRCCLMVAVMVRCFLNLAVLMLSQMLLVMAAHRAPRD